jgi:hypothetical protein
MHYCKIFYVEYVKVLKVHKNFEIWNLLDFGVNESGTKLKKTQQLASNKRAKS